jgi:hypothetical protein
MCSEIGFEHVVVVTCDFSGAYVHHPLSNFSGLFIGKEEVLLPSLTQKVNCGHWQSSNAIALLGSVCGLSRSVVLKLPNAVLHVVETPTTQFFLLLLCNCNFATVVNHNVNICVSDGLR